MQFAHRTRLSPASHALHEIAETLHVCLLSVRKWIRNLAALLEASPNAKVLVTKNRAPPPSPPSLTVDEESSDTESIESTCPGAAQPSWAASPTAETDEGEECASAPDWEAMRVARELLSLACSGGLSCQEQLAAPSILTSR